MATQSNVGTPLPLGELVTRWLTHLCAPTFVLLAGASLALSAEKRAGKPSQTRFIVTRGLLIAALDPIWMSLGFSAYERIAAQVLYAIGLSIATATASRRRGSRPRSSWSLSPVRAGCTAVTRRHILTAGRATCSPSRCNFPAMSGVDTELATIGAVIVEDRVLRRIIKNHRKLCGAGPARALLRAAPRRARTPRPTTSRSSPSVGTS